MQKPNIFCFIAKVNIHFRNWHSGKD